MAPIFVHLYPRMAEAARAKGYALAVHGTLGRDFDLIAVPWAEDAAAPLELVEVLEKACGGWAAEYAITGEGEDRQPVKMPRARAHGRLAWLIYFRGGTNHGYVDLSVMPRNPVAQAAAGPEA